MLRFRVKNKSNHYNIKNLSIEALTNQRKSKGEHRHDPAESPIRCWCTTGSNCWCSFGGCTSLTHDGTGWTNQEISRHKNLEKHLIMTLKEVRRRQSLLKKHKIQLMKRSSKRK